MPDSLESRDKNKPKRTPPRRKAKRTDEPEPGPIEQQRQRMREQRGSDKPWLDPENPAVWHGDIDAD